MRRFSKKSRKSRELTTTKYTSGRMCSFRQRANLSSSSAERATEIHNVRATKRWPRRACSINNQTPPRAYTDTFTRVPCVVRTTRESTLISRYPILWPNGSISKTLRLAANRNSIRAGSRMETSVADTKLHSRRNLRNRSSSTPTQRYKATRDRMCIFFLRIVP